jgi:SAM-dependent methyltransferase
MNNDRSEKWEARYRQADPTQLPWYHEQPTAEMEAELDKLPGEGGSLESVNENLREADPRLPIRPILDVGCGTGADLAYLVESGRTAFGFDISPTALRFASESHPELTGRLFVADALRLPVRDGALAAVFDQGCLHCHHAVERQLYAGEVNRALAPDGVLLLRSRHEQQDADDPQNQWGPYRLSLDDLNEALGEWFELLSADVHYATQHPPHRRRRWLTWWKKRPVTQET